MERGLHFIKDPTYLQENKGLQCAYLIKIQIEVDAFWMVEKRVHISDD